MPRDGARRVKRRAALSVINPRRAAPRRQKKFVAITIYHSPACGICRNTLAMIRESGEEPRLQSTNLANAGFHVRDVASETSVCGEALAGYFERRPRRTVVVKLARVR
jgi:hypothetical protein